MRNQKTSQADRNFHQVVPKILSCLPDNPHRCSAPDSTSDGGGGAEGGGGGADLCSSG